MREPTAEALLEYLRNLFEKEFEIPQERVIPAARLVEDLELDSLDAVIVAMRVEEETGLELDEDEFRALDTVASVVALVQRRLQGQPGVAS
jgi:acyl carrier protein